MARRRKLHEDGGGRRVGASTSFVHELSEKEYVWRIAGLSWLPYALEQEIATSLPLQGNGRPW